MSPSKPLLYNPDQKSKQQLIAEFVIRRKEFANLMQGLEAATPRTSPQHYLVVGQRGMGKTTLLLRVKYAVEDHPQLNKWLVPIRFSEEQYQIARLDRFWEEIADHLSIADASFDGLLEEMEKHEDADDYERIALDLLIRALKKHKKRVLVMVDNLGDLFNKFSEEENHRLREVLLSKTEIQLMGASSVMLEHTFRYDKPFYEFFERIILDPINKEHAVELLRILGKQHGQEESAEQFIKANPTRIEVLRRLTGGVPRTMALLFGIFIDHQHGTTFEDLKLLIDQVNSLYKHRMDEMKPQQQRIVDALARAWDPISANEVLQRSKLNREGIATNQISAQLKVLTDNQVVEPVPGPGKNKTYRIRERFFNIWYLMRYGKKQHKEEVLWLVRFLETWCTKQELQLQAEEQVKALRLGNYSRQAAYLKTMALYHVEGIESWQKLQLLEHAEVYLNDLSEEAHARTIGKAKKNELDKWVNEIMEHLKLNRKLEVDEGFLNANNDSKLYIIYSVLSKSYKMGASILLIEELLKVGVQLGEVVCMEVMGVFYHSLNPVEAKKYYLMAIERGSEDTIIGLALLYDNENNFELAEKYYLMAVERDNVDAIEKLAELYYKENKFDLAEELCIKAIAKGSTDAIYNLAYLYHQNSDFILAEKYYLMAVEKGNSSAMFNLAYIYQNEYNNLDLAEKYYLMAAKKGDGDAMSNLALLYSDDRNKFEQAEKYYLMAIEKGDIDSIYCLALFYQKEKNDLELAEKYYLIAAEKGNSDAMFNLALLYQEEKSDIKLSEQYYLMAVAKGEVNAMLNLAYLYKNEKGDLDLAKKYYLMAVEKGDSDAMFNLASIYRDENKLEVAEEYYLMAISKGDTDAMNNLASMYYDDMVNKEQQVEEYLRLSHSLSNISGSFGLIIFYLNENKVEEMMQVIFEIIKHKEFYKDEKKVFATLYCILLKKQYHFLLQQFRNLEIDLMKHARPFYYVLAWFMRDELPGEYEKVGPEIKETVDEIIQTLQKEYDKSEVLETEMKE